MMKKKTPIIQAQIQVQHQAQIMTAFLPALYFTTIFLSGCATVQTRMPVPEINETAVETAAQETEALNRYLKLSRRLDRISAPILANNAELCAKIRTDFGIVTHTKKSYPKHLRDAAERTLGASEAPSVLIVRENGAAHKAGIKRGDVLQDTRQEPISALDDSLKNTAILHILRAGTELDIAITPKPVCGYFVRLEISDTINAHADGKSVFVTTALMDFVASDEELALVVGHELAHNTMGHVRKAFWNKVVSGFTSSGTEPLEREADYVGLYYVARAGFNLDGIEGFWRRLGAQHPESIVRRKGHPETPKRLLAIRMAAKEIADKRAVGEKLVPNYK